MMNIYVSRDFIPGVKEFRAGVRAWHMPPGMGRAMELRTVFTGIIAMTVIIATVLLLLLGRSIPTSWWLLVGSVGTFYFLDPKALASSIVTNLNNEQPVKPPEGGPKP